jgi:hypothetical protein
MRMTTDATSEIARQTKSQADVIEAILASLL